MPLPPSLQGTIDRFAAQRARLGPKRADLSPKRPESPANPAVSRLSPALGRPVLAGEAIWAWWAHPDR